MLKSWLIRQQHIVIQQLVSRRFEANKFARLLSIGLGCIFLICFISLIYQFNDLYGPHGLDIRLHNNPSFFIRSLLSSVSYSSLIWLAWIGTIFSVVLIAGFVPFYALLFNVVIYATFVTKSSGMLHFQWDYFLIEAGLMSLFILSPTMQVLRYKSPYRLAAIHCLPLLLLIMRIFIHSGWVKLLSLDPLWLTNMALLPHFYSQPLPHFLSLAMHQLMIQFNLSTLAAHAMFIVECCVPFGLLIPHLRQLSCITLILFQCMIFLSGNYGFFNLLIIALLIPFLTLQNRSPHLALNSVSYRFILIPLMSVIILFSALLLFPQSKLPSLVPSSLSRYFILNSYGVFAKMTTNQTRYQVFVSNDASIWYPVLLKYYDHHGYPDMAFVQPYHPRIRWQLWFKFLTPYNYPSWYQLFIKQLANDPLSLTSVVQPNQALGKNYTFVHTCMQDIVFDYTNSSHDDSTIWNPTTTKTCQTFRF